MVDIIDDFFFEIFIEKLGVSGNEWWKCRDCMFLNSWFGVIEDLDEGWESGGLDSGWRSNIGGKMDKEVGKDLEKFRSNLRVDFVLFIISGCLIK